jgi:hypothetical protein
MGWCLKSIKSPLTPLFEKGGNAHTPTLLVASIGVLIILQAFISSPFDKGGQGDLIKKANRNIFMTSAREEKQAGLAVDRFLPRKGVFQDFCHNFHALFNPLIRHA